MNSLNFCKTIGIAMKKPLLPRFTKEKKEVPEIKSNPLISMRLSDEDKESFVHAAKLDGFKSLTTWLKWLGSERVKQQLEAEEGNEAAKNNEDKDGS